MMIILLKILVLVELLSQLRDIVNSSILDTAWRTEESRRYDLFREAQVWADIL
jgi:hypothetical protein